MGRAFVGLAHACGLMLAVSLAPVDATSAVVSAPIPPADAVYSSTVTMTEPHPAAIGVAPTAFVCPDGAREQGEAPPRGEARWCEALGPAGVVVRHGPYTAWYPSGVKKEEGEYRHGQRHGTWTRWNADGSKQQEAGFAADERHGRWVAYRDGVKVSEGSFRDGLPDGHWVTWHRNGRKAGEADFRDGRPVGPFTTWHPNGQKSAEGQFGDGGPEGDFTFWDSQARRRLVLRFADGRVGEILAWDQRGQAIPDAEERRAERDALFEGEPNTLLMLLMVTSSRLR